MISKNKNKKETPPQRVIHHEFISIDDRVSAQSGAGAGIRRASHHHRGRCCLTLKKTEKNYGEKKTENPPCCGG